MPGVDNPEVARDAHAPYQVLVVDDMATNRAMVRAILEPENIRITEAHNGDSALEQLGRNDFDAVILDVIMPGMNGFQVCRHLREEMGLSLTPVIMLTSLGSPDDVAMGLESGATDFVTKPYNSIELVARVKSAVHQKRLTDRLDDTESVLFALARMVEAKDQNTRDHCDRLSHMAVVFGQSLGCRFDELDALRRGGILHDIGKLGIPDAVLLKEGPLTDPEWILMREHPVIGARLCRPLRTMAKTVDIIHYHHEKWNGSGYPEGLVGAEIPLLARIFQIVDIYDALTTARPYKRAFTMEEAIRIMEDETEKGFWDPDLMPRFLAIARETPERLDLPRYGMRDSSARLFDNIVKRGLSDWDRG
jgi:putative two-component system response regulator